MYSAFTGWYMEGEVVIPNMEGSLSVFRVYQHGQEWEWYLGDCNDLGHGYAPTLPEAIAALTEYLTH